MQGWGYQTTTQSWARETEPPLPTEQSFSQYQPSTLFDSFGTFSAQKRLIPSQNAVPTESSIYQQQTNDRLHLPGRPRVETAADSIITYGADNSIHIQFAGRSQPSSGRQSQQQYQPEYQPNRQSQYEAQRTAVERTESGTGSNSLYAKQGQSQHQSTSIINSGTIPETVQHTANGRQKSYQLSPTFQEPTPTVAQESAIFKTGNNGFYQAQIQSHSQEPMPSVQGRLQRVLHSPSADRQASFQPATGFNYQQLPAGNDRTGFETRNNKLYQPQTQPVPQPQQYLPATVHKTIPKSQYQSSGNANRRVETSKNRFYETQPQPAPNAVTRELVHTAAGQTSPRSRQTSYQPSTNIHYQGSRAAVGVSGSKSGSNDFYQTPIQPQPQNYAQPQVSQNGKANDVVSRNTAYILQQFLSRRKEMTTNKAVVPARKPANQVESYSQQMQSDSVLSPATQRTILYQSQSYIKPMRSTSNIGPAMQRNVVNQPDSYIQPMPVATPKLMNRVYQPQSYSQSESVLAVNSETVTEGNRIYRGQTSQVKPRPAVQRQTNVQTNKKSSKDIQSNMWNIMSNFLRMQSVSDLKALLSSPNILNSLKGGKKDKSAIQPPQPLDTVYTSHQQNESPQTQQRSQSESNVQQLWSVSNGMAQPNFQQGIQQQANILPTNRSRVGSSTYRGRPSDMQSVGHTGGMSVEHGNAKPASVDTASNTKGSVSSKIHFSSVAAGPFNEYKPKPTNQIETNAKYLKSSIGTAQQAIQNVKNNDVPKEAKRKPYITGTRDSLSQEPVITDTRGGVILPTTKTNTGTYNEPISVQSSHDNSKTSIDYIPPSPESSLSSSKGSNKVFPYRYSGSNSYQDNSQQTAVQPSTSAPWDSLYPQQNQRSRSKTTDSSAQELPPWEMQNTPAPLPVPGIPRPPDIYNTSGRGQQLVSDTQYGPTGEIAYDRSQPGSAASGWRPSGGGGRPSPGRTHEMRTRSTPVITHEIRTRPYPWKTYEGGTGHAGFSAYLTTTTATTPTIPTTTTMMTTTTTTTLPPTTTTTTPRPSTARPKKKYKGSLIIRPLKRGDPPNWNAFDAVGK